MLTPIAMKLGSCFDPLRTAWFRPSLRRQRPVLLAMTLALAPTAASRAAEMATAPAGATKVYRHVGGGYQVSISSEWTVRERTPQADLDMIIRSPDRDQCAVYFGRESDDASRKGIDISLKAMADRVATGSAERRVDALPIGAAKGILISVYDAQNRSMLWHLCAGYRNRIYYLGVEALPGSGRRELPPRIREILVGLVFAGMEMPPSPTPARSLPAGAPTALPAIEFQSTPLVSRKVVASAKPQTIACGDRLQITLPGKLLQTDKQLTVATMRALPPATVNDFKLLAAYDVSLEDQHEFMQDIVLEQKIDPAEFDPAQSPESQVRFVRWDPAQLSWVLLPSSVDLRRGTVTARTRHLSVLACLRRGQLLCYNFLADSLYDAIHRPMPPAGEIDSRGFETHNFSISYSIREINTTPRIAKWNQAGPPADRWAIPGDQVWDSKNPEFVKDVSFFLEKAYQTYAAKGFWPVPTKNVPIAVYLNAREGAPPASYQQVTGRMDVTIRPVNSNRDDFKHSLAHETFHAVQGAYLEASEAKMANHEALWWIESAAEYASCRIVWNLPLMGGSYQHVYPFLLSRPLTFAGDVKDRHDPMVNESTSLDYDKGYFIDFLVHQGADFHALNEAVMSWYRTHDTPLPGFEDYLLTATGKSLGEHFRNFAGWFLLSQESPLARRESEVPGMMQGNPLIAVENPKRQPDEIYTPKGMSYDVPLEKTYTAKCYAYVSGDSKDNSALTLELKADAISPSCLLDLYVLRDNQRKIGLAPPTASLSRQGDSAKVQLKKGDVLYVVSMNLSESSVGRTAYTVAAPQEPPNGNWVLRDTPAHSSNRRQGSGAARIAFNSSEGKVTGSLDYDLVVNSETVHRHFEGGVTWDCFPEQVPGDGVIRTNVACRMDGNEDENDRSTYSANFKVFAQMLDIRPSYLRAMADIHPSMREPKPTPFTIKMPQLADKPVRIPITVTVQLPFAGDDTYTYEYEWVPPKKSGKP